MYKRKIWLKACLKLRVECGWDLILARISIGRIHGLFDLQPCCIYMLFYSFMTRVEFWIRPDRCPPVHYAETSMKNGFGLKYIHKFLNLPFLLLQVCILWKIYLAWSRRSVSKRKRRDGNGWSRTREVWDDLTHTSHFLTPPLLLRCLLSRFVLLTESLEQAKLLNVTFCLIRPPDAQ